MPLILRWPTENTPIVQEFGVNHTGVPDFYTRFDLPAHEGVDFRAPVGTPVYACADGRVAIAGAFSKSPAYGIQVRIEHLVDGEIYETIYAHLSKVAVKAGSAVACGQLIGYAGNTGNSRGPHLHLTLKHRNTYRFVTTVNGKRLVYKRGIIDPTPYLRRWDQYSAKEE